MTLRVQLHICEACKQGAIIVNGVHQTHMEFHNVEGKAVVTPHSATCERLERKR